MTAENISSSDSPTQEQRLSGATSETSPKKISKPAKPVPLLYPGRRKWVAIALWFIGFFGYFNFHSFYLGQFKRGLGKLIAFLVASIYISNSNDTSTSTHGFFAFVVVGLFIWNLIGLFRITLTPRGAFGESARPEDRTPGSVTLDNTL